MNEFSEIGSSITTGVIPKVNTPVNFDWKNIVGLIAIAITVLLIIKYITDDNNFIKNSGQSH